MDDGYMGSGKVIRSAMKKYGIENFTKTILEQFDDSAAMFAREKEVVTDEFLLREDVYNLRRGGFGGFDYINSNNLSTRKVGWNDLDREKAEIARKSLDWHKIHKNRFEKVSYETRLSWNTNGRIEANSESTKLKRINTYKEIGHQQGDKNSQSGTIWITNEIESKKIKKIDPIPDGWRKGRRTLVH
jgi:hypothetical protein